MTGEMIMLVIERGTLYEDNQVNPGNQNLYTITTSSDGVRLRVTGSLNEDTTLRPVLPEITIRAKTGVFSYTMLQVYYDNGDISPVQGLSNANLNPGLGEQNGTYWFRQDKLR